MERRSVLQDWVAGLSFMQQSVLISSIRGADGLHKDHISKYILRWLRRCVLISAFEGKVLTSPIQLGGGSFTGPIQPLYKGHNGLGHVAYESDDEALDRVMNEYLRSTDEIPHHFHMHVMHAAEIIGYKHPDAWTKKWWYEFYLKMVSDAHLFPETTEQMDRRLGDVEAQWKERELVPAADVPKVQTVPYVELYVVRHLLTGRYFESREPGNELWTDFIDKAQRFKKEEAENCVRSYAQGQKFMEVIFHSSKVV